jgi:hypothetical protein
VKSTLGKNRVSNIPRCLTINFATNASAGRKVRKWIKEDPGERPRKRKRQKVENEEFGSTFQGTTSMFDETKNAAEQGGWINTDTSVKPQRETFNPDHCTGYLFMPDLFPDYPFVPDPFPGDSFVPDPCPISLQTRHFQQVTPDQPNATSPPLYGVPPNLDSFQTFMFSNQIQELTPPHYSPQVYAPPGSPPAGHRR